MMFANKYISNTFFVLLSVTLLGFGAACLADDLVILESNSVRYPVGQIVAGDLGITLAEQEMLTIVAANGTMFKIEGPFDGVPSVTATDVPPVKAALEQLLASDKLETSGLGAVRSGEDDATQSMDTRPTPWYIHVDQAGEQCFTSGSALALWREDNQAAQEVELQRLSTAESVVLVWPAGSNALDWPESLAAEDGEIYLIRPVDQIQSTQIITLALPSGSVSSDASAVAWLAAKGCPRQAEKLMGKI
jgi:hypothetical protein